MEVKMVYRNVFSQIIVNKAVKGLNHYFLMVNLAEHGWKIKGWRHRKQFKLWLKGILRSILQILQQLNTIQR